MNDKIESFYKLLPESIRKVVEHHMQPIDNATADYLCLELEDYLKQIQKQAEKNKNIDLVLIDRMIKCFKALLKRFPFMNEDEKLVISAATRYFIDFADAQSDFDDVFGFDDDLAVLNAALLATGREQQVVQR